MDRLLSEQEICQASLSSLCAHCTCKETGKPEYIPCQLYDSTALAIAAQLAKTDKEWVSKLESIMNMYEECEDECDLCLFRDGCVVKKLKAIIADLTGRSIGL
jgi:hypothetical protein